MDMQFNLTLHKPDERSKIFYYMDFEGKLAIECTYNESYNKYSKQIKRKVF